MLAIRKWFACLAVVAVVALLSGCSLAAGGAGTPIPGPGKAAGGAPLNVLATTTFLADIAQNVAGDRLTVDSLIPLGVDAHGFQPTPADVATVAKCDVLVVNGAGFEGGFLSSLLANAGGEHLVIAASAGLQERQSTDGEQSPGASHGQGEETDPHFWLDPNNAVRYVENIRDGLSKRDPAGAAEYAANAESYMAQLEELDRWVAKEVEQLPPERRLLVTNHEAFGYFADRYGFTVVGSIIPSVTTGTEPTAGDLARLVAAIEKTDAPAIFLETGSNPKLADQLARETGIKVAPPLYTHSVSEPGGDAPTYLNMIRYNTRTIVEALK
ncbi:MAG: metal ABC transporter substrate-binding protein [Dehalococcoidales bacterium]|nr:metal ABC transporter substrate-binding protein [Dehalococcoidales bacterium]